MKKVSQPSESGFVASSPTPTDSKPVVAEVKPIVEESPAVETPVVLSENVAVEEQSSESVAEKPKKFRKKHKANDEVADDQSEGASDSVEG
jgi:hypothetical protein